MNEVCEIAITAPDPAWLLSLTRRLVEDRLCASAHNHTPVRSTYWWKGEMTERAEGRATLHTRKSLVPQIVARIKTEHPYEVPGIWTSPITDGNPDYLKWILDETREA